MKFTARILCILLPVILLGPAVSHACIGTECLQIWSTEPGGGALIVEFDFERKVQTYRSFCAGEPSLCFYTAIDPGFIATPVDTPGDEFYLLENGTRVRIEVVSISDGLAISINSQRLRAGESASLGEMPNIHVHPSWQVSGPGDAFGDYELTYRITTDSEKYADSAEVTVIVTNVEPPPEPTPTPSPTPEVTPCLGDCDDDERVTVDEILRGVSMVLGSAAGECPAFDSNRDDVVSVDEISGAVVKALEGCESVPVATFEEIQETIFTPRCAVMFCHDSTSKTGALDLSAGMAYEQLVDVEPDILSARAAGLLRVRPGDPETSFLWIKLVGPPRSQGSRMPLTGDPLIVAEIDLVRNWILQGALP